ncbi:MAG TPA: NADH-quinone oxidoreductase subunit M [Bacteroidales bacterium]
MLTISLILFPLLASLILFLWKNRKGYQQFALIASLAELILGLIAIVNFDKSLHLNYDINIPWIKSMGINLYVGMDGLSLLLVALTVILVPFILLSTFHKEGKYSSTFFALILMMEAALVGVFTSLDGLLFYIFWELTLIPIYFICGLWGGENRIKITLKFFIYTMLGSLLMLAGLIYLYSKTPLPHQFGLGSLLNARLSETEQMYVFWAFFVGFAVKIPVFPFHSWQPDTYTVAPAQGSMLLAGIMLKMGIYGLIRFLMPICGDVMPQLAPVAIILGIIGLLYGSVIAIKQPEIKRLIAYSSMAHVGLMAAAVLVFQRDALQGSIYQMLSHGFNIVALFFVADIIQRRTQTTQISELGGIAKVAPRFAIFFMIVMLGSVALPLTNGFIGEFLMLVGIAKCTFWGSGIVLSGIAGISIILGAVYMFWLYQRTMYGVPKSTTANFSDLNMTEMLIAVPMVIIIIGMGVYPKPVLEIVKPLVESTFKFIIFSN